MRIDNVIFGVNADPMYYQFWNTVSKIFKVKFGIHPVLCFCGNVKPEYNLGEDYGTIIEFPIAEDVPEYLHATWVRFYCAKMFPDAVCLLGDIDMLPISRNFYIDNLVDVSDDHFTHILADAYCPGDFDRWRQHVKDYTVPAHHHVAKGSLYQDVFRFEDTWIKEIRKFANTKLGVPHPERPGWTYWCADEVYPTIMMRAYCDNGGIIQTPGYTQKMLSRPYHHYTQEDLSSDRYFACHSPRPYAMHMEWIDKLTIDILRSGS